ncbi:MAG TPA: glycoside hydrolase family 2 TIM barrel-domain containing protein, partial [Opitutaceae bacterium]
MKTISVPPKRIEDLKHHAAFRGAIGFALSVAILAGKAPARTTGDDRNVERASISLDQDWRFHLGADEKAIAPNYDDSLWRRVDVPHDYVIEGTFVRENPFGTPGRDPSWYSLHGFLPVQPAVYRKSIEIPAADQGKQLWLEFDGVFSNSHYWLNGKEVGAQYSGYTRSRFDITSAAHVGEKNILTVQVDPHYDGWWYEGGGIYRHVRLIAVDPLHIAPDGVFVSCSVSNPGDGSRADASINVQTEVANLRTSPETSSVVNEIIDDHGSVVASSSVDEKIAPADSQTSKQIISLPQANLWSPEHPYLYRLRTRVLAQGNVVDQLETRFGVRVTQFDPSQGFFLNGQSVKLKGVNLHGDHAGVGVAIPDRLFTWRLERLKEVGCNAIRLSHNPVEPFLLDECDRLGFLVIAENRHLGDTFIDQTPKDTPAVEHRDLSALVMRDRNHPSIILWSLCNEQWIQGSQEAAAMARSMRARVLELDPTRPITAAMNGGFDQPEGFLSVLDVTGVNYHPDEYNKLHRAQPNKPIVATEIASEVSTRGIYTMNHWDSYYGEPEHGYLSAYSINAGPGGQTVEEAWTPVATNAFVGGGFVWTSFDYKGEPRPLDWPQINSNYGFLDICGFPKDSYYYYKSWWTDTPVIHLFPHWNWAGKEGQEIPVWVHTNCEEVELFLNGVSLGKQKTERYRHLEWKVKYQPGQLVAKGIYKGKMI